MLVKSHCNHCQEALTVGPGLHVQGVVALVHVPGCHGGADGHEARLHEASGEERRQGGG